MTAIREAKLGRIRKTIARRLTESKQTIPHFYIQTSVDMARVLEQRRLVSEPPTITAYIVEAVARVLSVSPEYNVAWRDDEIVALDGVGIGVAVATDSGLLVVTKPDVDRASLEEIDHWLKAVAVRAGGLRLQPADLGPKSLVVSNLGAYAVDSFYAIIDPPDPMILAVGRISDEVVVVDGQLRIRPVATLSISVDHRVIDGALAARFLTAIKAEMERDEWT